jgi:spore germination cell wall hydrolase CwlJ-like protein
MATTPLSQAIMAGMDPNVYRPLSDIQRGNAMAEAGMDSSPTTGWGAIGRLAQALSGSYISNSASSELARTIAGGKKSATEQLMEALQGSKTAAIPTAPPSMAQAPLPVASSPNKIYSNDEPSPLDPPSGDDRAKMVATILGEAGNEPQLGKNAVASVIRTRAVDGGYGGNTPSAVVTAPSQFEPWNTPEGRARMAQAAADPKQAAAAEAAIASAYGEGGKAPNDPTEGMTHFYSPGAQAALGRSAPAWAGGDSVQIGGHVFNSPDDPAAIPAAAQPAQGYAAPPGQPASQTGGVDVHKLMAVLQNPYSDDATKALAGKLLAAHLTPTEVPAGFERSPDGGFRPTAGGPASPEYLRKKAEATPTEDVYGVIGEDPMTGAKKYGFTNAHDKTVNGKALAESAAATGGGPNALENIDSSKTGEDYLKQFPPEIQTGVKDYLEGRRMPTGNPRRSDIVKQVASKYGNDIGMPADDTSFGARRTMLNDLNKTTPGSIGGQITFARTSLNHLGEVAKAAEDLHNVDWGFTPLNSAVNSLRSMKPEQAAKVAALQDAAQHYGQEVTKFYAGSPGGEAERTRFLTALGAAKSPQELAAVVESERNLIPGRMSEVENRIKGTLGPAAQKYPVHSEESSASLKHIDATVARMRGLKPAGETTSPSAAAAPSSAPKAISSKADYDALPSGSSYIAPDGSVRTKK